ncbi:integral membrane protein [Streptomyces sulfonofaciens]|uniref:Integral membrane protein n=1 Tax=Streptomyces sulfonofaciens TaxID=68272 RepID=A0A919G0B8_9ACTN|nr:DoxX family protein [Streptomyces sulfonofaciens]GHH75269.1 integral membrane protein [Streptomyces sulfonofaciens]
MSTLLPDRWNRLLLGLFRLVTGLLFTCHGAATLFGVLGGAETGRTPHFPQWPSWWAAAIELAGGVLVTTGLFTRAVALICSGSMAYAYFSVHQQHALLPIQNGGEPAVMFCWAFLTVAVVGPGAMALDGLLPRRSAWRTSERRELATAGD